MAEEAWLDGELDDYAPMLMPSAYALVQAIVDLKSVTANLSDEELLRKPYGAPSIAFHLRHISGSIERLLTYSRGVKLNDAQFEFLTNETADFSDSNVAELTQKAVDSINNALDELKTVAPESLFEQRFVGRKKLATNVFGLLFHIAEHTARHVGQIVTTAKIITLSEVLTRSVHKLRQ